MSTESAATIGGTSTRSTGLTPRQERGRQLASTSTIRRIGDKFVVPSQTQAKTSNGYVVDLVRQTCTCPDFTTTGNPCKHQEATLYWIAWGRDVDSDGFVTETVTIKKKTYAQNWPAYEKAQRNKLRCISRLLFDLCQHIDEPARIPGRPGRNPISLRELTFSGVMKVFFGIPARNVSEQLDGCVARGYCDGDWSFNKLYKFLNNPAHTELLMTLVHESAKPLHMIEGGHFAADATGFSTRFYERWFERKHGKLVSQKEWVKLHMMCGVTTHGITGVVISKVHDCPVMPELVRQTMRNFNVKKVSLDKGYLSIKNFEVLQRCEIEPFIMFKKDSVINGSDAWSKAILKFLMHREDFLRNYHMRSNAETVFAMLKANFGSFVFARNEIGQTNEVLCKVLCHNLWCLVVQIFEANLAPVFWSDMNGRDFIGPRPSNGDGIEMPDLSLVLGVEDDPFVLDPLVFPDGDGAP